VAKKNKASKNKVYLLLVILVIAPFIVLSIFIFDNSSANEKTDGLSSNMIKGDLAGEINNYYVINDANYKIEIGREQLLESLQNAKNWLFSNFNTGGYFTYEYDPLKDQYSNNNNMIRQLMNNILHGISCITSSDALNSLPILSVSPTSSLQGITIKNLSKMRSGVTFTPGALTSSI